MRIGAIQTVWHRADRLAFASAAAASIFTTYMPGAIEKHVPGNNATLNALLYSAPSLYGREVSGTDSRIAPDYQLTPFTPAATPWLAHQARIHQRLRRGHVQAGPRRHHRRHLASHRLLLLDQADQARGRPELGRWTRLGRKDHRGQQGLGCRLGFREQAQELGC